jgi:ribonuclease III
LISLQKQQLASEPKVSTGLEAKIHHRFTDKKLLVEALTHRSFGIPHNERLEFIGDSALNCTIALDLYSRFPTAAEGQLSRLRASIVSRDPLARVAQQLDLGAALKLGDGELRSGGRERLSILADAMEAVFGAIVMDAGFEAARAVILRLFAGELSVLTVESNVKDAKTALQEWLQGRKLDRPEYVVSEIIGEQHAQLFRVTCRIASRGVEAIGEGVSRRAAEQGAAQRTLELLMAAGQKGKTA